MIVVGYADGSRKQEHQNAILLRDRLLHRYLGADETAVYRTEKGRPCLRQRDADISVTHSFGGVLVALVFDETHYGLPAEELPDERRFPVTAPIIGADMEILTGKQAERCLGVARRFFFPDEQERLAAIADPDAVIAEFSRMWTQKESFLKAAGVGIAGLGKIDTDAFPSEVSFIGYPLRMGEKDFYVSLCTGTRAELFAIND